MNKKMHFFVMSPAWEVKIRPYPDTRQTSERLGESRFTIKEHLKPLSTCEFAWS